MESARALSGHHPRPRPPSAQLPCDGASRRISRTATTRSAATGSRSISTIEGDKIDDVSFEGRGCAISTASASLMTEVLKGKTLAEARGAVRAVPRQGDGRRSAGDCPRRCRTMSNASSRSTGVKAYPARVKCATLAVARLRGGAENRRTSARRSRRSSHHVCRRRSICFSKQPGAGRRGRRRAV